MSPRYLAVLEDMVQEYAAEHRDDTLRDVVDIIRDDFLYETRVAPTRSVVRLIELHIIDILLRDFRIYLHHEDETGAVYNFLTRTIEGDLNDYIVTF